ncbi:transporter [Ruminococcaceae bacterium OttesenSCG-928-I18]|nr:transporter [Ruminococcaceae bacterium OttesenSCG-928-I18]
MESIQAILLSAAVGGTAGVLVGGITSAVRQRKRKERYSQQQIERMGSLFQSVFRFLTKSVYYVLGIALIWTIYYMVLGIMDHSLNEYAANSATLIVSVVTVFSILIAFHEFLHRKD